MQDFEIEGLLKKYRPAEPSSDLEARILQSLNHPITPSPDRRTWPWAVAAAALLAITVGLHMFAIASSAGREAPLDTQRVAAIAAELGGPEARAMAEYIVLQEQRADAEAQQARLTEPTREAGAR